MSDFTPSCPIPLTDHPTVQLAHGGGGTMMNTLIEQAFLPSFANPLLEQRHDGAVFDVEEGSLAFSTDSYVVCPLEFPGGDIGTLAVNGTVNDLAMCGARPLYLSAGFIIEEGFPLSLLNQIAFSMAKEARVAGVQIITGDTKVVPKNEGSGISPSANFLFILSNMASSKARDFMTWLCSDTQAPIWLPRGRVTKYFNDSVVGIFLAIPVIFT